jgi:hypothetical protein
MVRPEECRLDHSSAALGGFLVCDGKRLPAAHLLELLRHRKALELAPAHREDEAAGRLLVNTVSGGTRFQREALRAELVGRVASGEREGAQEGGEGLHRGFHVEVACYDIGMD